MTLNTIITDVLSYSWPTIVLASVILISLRITYLIQNKKKFILFEEFMNFSFIIYILIIFQVVTYQDVSTSGANYMPFKEIFRYSLGSQLFFKNVIGNMIIFIPFGLFTAYYLKLKKIINVLILSIVASFTIETIQLIIGRVFDIDDIILNVLGAVIGYFLYKFAIRIQSKIPNLLKKYYISNIIIIVLIILLIMYMFSFFQIGA